MISLSGLGIRVMVASQNEFGSVPPPEIWDQKARPFYSYIKQSLDLGCLRVVMLSKQLKRHVKELRVNTATSLSLKTNCVLYLSVHHGMIVGQKAHFNTFFI